VRRESGECSSCHRPVASVEWHERDRRRREQQPTTVRRHLRPAVARAPLRYWPRTMPRAPLRYWPRTVPRAPLRYLPKAVPRAPLWNRPVPRAPLRYWPHAMPRPPLRHFPVPRRHEPLARYTQKQRLSDRCGANGRSGYRYLGVEIRGRW